MDRNQSFPYQNQESRHPKKLLKVINSILFIITKGNIEKAVIGYKEQSQKNANIAKVDTYFATDWNDAKLNETKIKDLDIDMVYDNFILQIAGDRLATQKSELNSPLVIRGDIDRMKEREKIQK